MSFPRKTWFVNPRLQFTLILGANVLALASAALIYTLVFYAQSQMQVWAATLAAASGPGAPAFITQATAELVRWSVIAAVVQFVLFNAAAVLMSQRIAGPLYRLERHLRSVGDGREPIDVKFRKGDMYQELAEATNTVMARLRSNPGRA